MPTPASLDSCGWPCSPRQTSQLVRGSRLWSTGRLLPVQVGPQGPVWWELAWTVYIHVRWLKRWKAFYHAHPSCLLSQQPAGQGWEAGIRAGENHELIMSISSIHPSQGMQWVSSKSFYFSSSSSSFFVFVCFINLFLFLGSLFVLFCCCFSLVFVFVILKIPHGHRWWRWMRCRRGDSYRMDAGGGGWEIKCAGGQKYRAHGHNRSVGRHQRLGTKTVRRCWSELQGRWAVCSAVWECRHLKGRSSDGGVKWNENWAAE